MSDVLADAGANAPSRSATARCAATPVSPTIAVAAPKLVLVKKPYQTDAHRIELKLGTSGNFTGSGSLTCSAAAKVALYDKVRAGQRVALPHTVPGATLTRGVTLYIEGAAASAAMRDITFTLTLTPGGEPVQNNPATDTCTAIELGLDLGQYKPAPGGADPALLGGDVRIGTGRNLHLQTENLYAGRCLLVVSQAKPADYTGDVVLRAKRPSVRCFAYGDEGPAKGQTALADPLSTPNANIPGTGLKLWVEGCAASGSLRDSGFTVEISDLPRREGDRANVTVVQAVLDIGQSRVDAGTAPTMMPAMAKLTRGRFLHVTEGDFFARAKVSVRRTVPDTFRGKLELRVVDNRAADSAAITIHSAETAGAARANPYPFDHTGAYPAAGGTDDLWAEGATVSGAVRDRELRLRVTDAEGYSDRARFTVARFKTIKATIKSTPANTAGRSAAPADHTFTNNGGRDPDFTNNAPLVLMRNAQPDIALEATAEPADLPVAWAAVRNPADHASLGAAAALPTVTADASNRLKATLNANQKGSFRIRAYIDNNADNKWSEGEPSIPLNLVLADVAVVSDGSAGYDANLTSQAGGGLVTIRNGTWPGSWAASIAAGGAGMTMELVADVTGGGADGRLGLDKVFGGLINDLSGNAIALTYTDSTGVRPVRLTVSNRYVTNRASATGDYGGTPLFLTADPRPALMVFPVLDTGRPGGGVGGETATMTRSGPWDLSVNRPVGQRRTLRCIDSPGRGFLLAHPVNGNAALTAVHYEQRFTANFCFWTNVAAGRGASGDAADRTYSVVRRMDWSATGEWTVTYPGGVATLTVVTPHTITVSGGRTFSPIDRVQGNGIEVRPPSGITDAIAWQTT